MTSEITYVTGGAHDRTGAYHGYHTDQAAPATSVVDRFIGDGLDGELLITAEEPVPGRTETISTIEGTPKTVLYTIVHQMRVYQRGGYGAAHYWRGDSTTGRAWITHSTSPPHDPPQIDGTGWYDGEFPPHAIIPIDTVHTAIREFLHTGQQPTTVTWQHVPSD